MNRFRFGTNLALWLVLCTVNAQLEYSPLEHWSVGVGGRFNSFVFESEAGVRHHRMQRSICAGGRWWPCRAFHGWWLGPVIAWQEYDNSLLHDALSQRGVRYGGGISAGYSFEICRHLGLDLGVGVWAGSNVFAVQSGSGSEKERREGVGAFVRPYELVVALNYDF